MTTQKEGDGKFPLDPSKIENIDLAVYKWLDEVMNLYATTNRGWAKTPVIWVSGERSFQIKNKKELRQNDGSFILPVITLKRTAISKDLKTKGIFPGNVVPNLFAEDYLIVKEINQDKSTNFANADSQKKVKQPNFKRENKKVVYGFKSIKMPVQANFEYEIHLRTEYQQQMNELVQPFITNTGAGNYFIIENEGHRYEAFLDASYSLENNGDKLEQEERMFKTIIKLNVTGHMVNAGANELNTNIVYRENAVEVKIPREYTMTNFDLASKKKQ
jgi:hypothetical protein